MIRIVFITICSLFIFSCGSSPVQMFPSRRNQPSKLPPVVPTQIVKMPISISQSTQPIPAQAVKNPTTIQAQVPLVNLPSESKDLLTVIMMAGISKAKTLEAIASENELAAIDKVLEAATSNLQIQPYRTVLSFKAAQLAQKKRQPDLALQYYRSIAALYPQSPQAIKANAEINLILALQEVDPKVIGAVLPLSGKNANIGQHALNTIRIGLGLNKPGSKLRLAIFDTQGNPELATAGVEKLIRDDKVIALIGGLSSKEALAAGQKADLLGVPFIGLSQKSGLTGIGDYVFRNSLTAEMQIDRLVQHAFEKLNAKRFAVLYPNDAYGIEFANIYWDHVLARGGKIMAAQTYDPKENDFTSMIQKMTGTYYQEARPEEYTARLKEIALEKKSKADKNKNKAKVKPKDTRANEVLESVLAPILDFDVLFIPDTGKTLSQVMAFLKVNDVPPLTFLGTNIWNNNELSKRVGSTTNQIYFVDAIDLSDSSPKETQFYKDYFAEFNEEPTLIEMQVFEAAKIIRDLLADGVASRDSLASGLRSLGRTTGVTGELRMSSQRELERPLHILSIEAGTIKKIE